MSMDDHSNGPSSRRADTEACRTPDEAFYTPNPKRGLRKIGAWLILGALAWALLIGFVILAVRQPLAMGIIIGGIVLCWLLAEAISWALTTLLEDKERS